MEARRDEFVSVDLEKLVSREYDFQTDENIVESVRLGDGEALEYLIHKYRNFVRAKARSYFLIGAEREDIVQEGMIGLYKSIRDFRGDK
ncbi:MAG: sigH, partial [Cohnella sp.]|nr:sigH [Cohnella sp.]